MQRIDRVLDMKRFLFLPLSLLLVNVVALANGSARIYDSQSTVLPENHWSKAVVAGFCTNPQWKIFDPRTRCLRDVAKDTDLSRLEVAYFTVKVLESLGAVEKFGAIQPATQAVDVQNIGVQEADDALHALIIEFAPEIEKFDMQTKGAENATFFAASNATSSTESLAWHATQNTSVPDDVVPDIPRTHWLYTTLFSLFNTSAYEKCSPFYEQGTQGGTIVFTRYEFAVFLAKRERTRTELKRKNRPSCFSPGDKVKTLDLESRFTILKLEFGPELCRWHLLPDK